MNKDMIIASAIGFTSGLAVAILLWVGPRFIQRAPQKEPTLSSTKKSESESTFTVKTPSDNEIFSEKEIIVSGEANAGNLIVITSPVDEEITKTHDDGSYKISINLEEGENALSATSYGKNGEIIDIKELSVIYSTQDL